MCQRWVVLFLCVCVGGGGGGGGYVCMMLISTGVTEHSRKNDMIHALHNLAFLSTECLDLS